LRGSGIHCGAGQRVKSHSVVEVNVTGTADPWVPAVEVNVTGTADPWVPAVKIIRIPCGGGQKLAHPTW